MRIFCILVGPNDEQLHSGQAFRIPAGASLTLRDVRAQVLWALGMQTSSTMSLKLRHPKNTAMTFPLLSDRDIASLNDNDVVIAQETNGNSSPSHTRHTGSSSSSSSSSGGSSSGSGSGSGSGDVRGGGEGDGNEQLDLIKPMIIVADAATQMLPASDIVGKLVVRVKARQNGDFKKADRIRNELIRAGIHVADRAGHITAAAPSKQAAYDAALSAARAITGGGSPISSGVSPHIHSNMHG